MKSIKSIAVIFLSVGVFTSIAAAKTVTCSNDVVKVTMKELVDSHFPNRYEAKIEHSNGTSDTVYSELEKGLFVQSATGCFEEVNYYFESLQRGLVAKLQFSTSKNYIASDCPEASLSSLKFTPKNQEDLYSEVTSLNITTFSYVVSPSIEEYMICDGSF